MADNVSAIDAILADGSRHRFGAVSDNLGAEIPAGIAELIQRLRALGAREAEEIAARFPKQLRRVGGYNIDALTPAARAAGRDNLARLLVGSEGTLAFSAAVELILHPIKPRKMLGICQFPTFREAMEASRHIVALDPEAVELVDRTMIDLGRSIPIYRATIDKMLIGEPDSLLIVEFHGDADAPLLARLDRARNADGRSRSRPRGRARDGCRLPGGDRLGARGRAEHHDVDEGRREAGLVHRGLRRRSRRPRRLHRAAERGVRAARHEGHLVRPCLGRLPACPPGAEHEGPGRRAHACARSPRNVFPSCANTRARTAASTATASCAASSTRRCSAPASCARSRR